MIVWATLTGLASAACSVIAAGMLWHMVFVSPAPADWLLPLLQFTFAAAGFGMIAVHALNDWRAS